MFRFFYLQVNVLTYMVIVTEAAYVTQILRLVGDDVMVMLLCGGQSSTSSESSSESVRCAADASTLRVYARRQRSGASAALGVSNQQLRHLALDLRTRTLACVRTSPLRTIPPNGRSNNDIANSKNLLKATKMK